MDEVNGTNQNNKKMKVCKHCNEQIAKTAKVCPHCGGKNKKPLYRRVWFIALVIIVLIAAFGQEDTQQGVETQSVAQASVSTQAQAEEPEETAAQEEEHEEAEIEEVEPSFGAGTYLVGEDLQAGLYKVVLEESLLKMGYVERSSGLSMELSDILANIILTGDGYVEVLDTDVAVKFQGVSATMISLETLEQNIQTEVSDGMYLVGYDIAPGVYKVSVEEDDMGYVERASAASMGLMDIIANELVQGQSYVEIMETDFVVRVQGATLTKQE